MQELAEQRKMPKQRARMQRTMQSCSTARYSSTPGHTQGSRTEKGEHRAAMDLLPGLPRDRIGCISSCHGRREASAGCSGRVWADVLVAPKK
jgi:hypothetical protein